MDPRDGKLGAPEKEALYHSWCRVAPCVEEDPGEDVLEVCAPRDPHCVAATATAGSAVAWRAQ